MLEVVVSVRRVVVTGSRSFDDLEVIEWALRQVWSQSVDAHGCVPTLVHGGARGADRAAGRLYREHGPVEVVLPQWTDERGRVNRRAGFDRNSQMLALDDVVGVVAFHDNWSAGTEDTVVKAVRLGLPVWYFARHDGVARHPIYLTQENLAAALARPVFAEAPDSEAVAPAAGDDEFPVVKARSHYDRQQGFSRCGRCGEDTSSAAHVLIGGGWVACSVVSVPA